MDVFETKNGNLDDTYSFGYVTVFHFPKKPLILLKFTARIRSVISAITRLPLRCLMSMCTIFTFSLPGEYLGFFLVSPNLTVLSFHV